MKKKLIIVEGDGLNDIFIEGSYNGSTRRFSPEESTYSLGGAFRAGRTVIELFGIPHFKHHPSVILGESLGLYSGSDREVYIYTLASQGAYGPVLTRYIEKDVLLLETWNRKRKRTQVKELIVSDSHQEVMDNTMPYMIYFDYGINETVDIITDTVELLVIDSRYRTFPVEKINAKYKVWHCTASEYDREYAKNFDAVVNTMHDGPIRITDRINKQEAIIRPEKVPVVPFGEIGAGDTFTATLGSYMAYHAFEDMTKENWWHLLLESIPPAIKTAQSTLSTKYLSHIDVTIEDL